MDNSETRVEGVESSYHDNLKDTRLSTTADSRLSGRTILHMDMDAYFASLEQRDVPMYKGKPLLVCHGSESSANHGIVTAASYEARPYGIRSGISVMEARQKCPNGIYINANFNKYLETSRAIYKLCRDFTDVVEVYSIDEVFLDITKTWPLFGSPLGVAKKLQDLIKGELNLTCSVGIGPNRLVAKMASDLNKPAGITLLEKQDLPQAFAALPVGDLIGIGHRMKKHMRSLGIKTIGDLAVLPVDYLQKRWGVVGKALHMAANGLDNTAVVPIDVFNEVKSYGHSSSLGKGLKDLDLASQILLGLTEGVTRRMRKDNFIGKTVHLKLGFDRFVYVGRSKSLAEPTDLTPKVMETALGLLKSQKDMTDKFKITLIGVSVSNLKQVSLGRQVSVFDFQEHKMVDLNKAMDAVRDKYGERSIMKGSLLGFSRRHYGLSKVEVEEAQSPKTSFKVNRYHS